MRERWQRFKELLTLSKEKGTTLHRMQMLFLLTVTLAAIGVLLVLLSVTGVLSTAEHKVQDSLQMQQQNTADMLAKDMEELSARSIRLAETLSRILDNKIMETGSSVTEFSDNPDMLQEIQHEAFPSMMSLLQTSECSGVYMLLDATVNTNAPTAESSRSGLYLHKSNVNVGGTGNTYIMMFRGMPEIARENQIEMHNRWNLEFDTQLIPYYDELLSMEGQNPAESYFWTTRTQLTDTWEDVILLCVPMIGSNGEVYGFCGFEISEVFFRLSYPTIDSNFGEILTVLAPVENGSLLLKDGLSGGVSGWTATIQSEWLNTVKKGSLTYYNTEEGPAFVGLHSPIQLSRNQQGIDWAVVSMLPYESYSSYTNTARIVLTAISLAFLLLMLVACSVLSHVHVKPIVESLETLQNAEVSEYAGSNIKEINELYQFLRSKPTLSAISREEIPGGIAEMFDQFVERSHSLTESERNIFRLYVEGRQIAEIPELVYSSMSTVRKHNRSIYEKLGVASRDELMLYVELLRRCGRIHEIYSVQ